MGEMGTAANGEPLRALLGSCVGLVLHDPHQKIGGLAHVVLPECQRETDQPGKFADTAIPKLIEQMSEVSDRPLRLTAKLFGGASMFAHSAASSIGDQNVDACQRQLGDSGIPIIAQHCGGKQGRRILFNTGTGIVKVDVVGQDPVEL
jgi:chemotaxis protein CheD